MAYLSTSEWVLLAGLVLIALVLVARKPNEYRKSDSSEGMTK